MSSSWMIPMLIALLLSGLSDISRIQKLEEQNRELTSRLARLERSQLPPAEIPRREGEDTLEADADSDPEAEA